MSLESELSRQEAINSQLRSELNEIEREVAAAYSLLYQWHQNTIGTLSASADMLEASHRRAVDSVALQHNIDVLYEELQQMTLANKRIRECNNKKYYDFANYRTVRKLVQGVMDNLDVQMVSDAVIYKSIEKEHLKTPDYWLTCALLAIMAWRSDDKGLADRALKLAVSMDRKSTAVFFMLFNLRVDRAEAALKWFDLYRDCRLTGADSRTFLLLFSMLSKTLSESDSVSDEVRGEVESFVHSTVDAAAAAAGFSPDEMAARAEWFYDRMSGYDEVPVYPLLQQYCGGYSALDNCLRKAQGNIRILEFLKNVQNVGPLQRNRFIKAFIDELIARENAAEKEVYETIRYNETIIAYHGRVAEAKQAYEQTRSHNEADLNLIAEMIQWIFDGSEADVDPQARLNMFTLTKPYHEKGLGNYIARYRSADLQHQPVTIGDFSAVVDFADPAGASRSAAAFYEDRRDRELAQVKNYPAFIGFGIAAAAAAASPFVSLGLLAVTAIGAGFGVIKLLLNKSNRRQIGLRCEDNIRAADDILRSLFGEYGQYMQKFGEMDAYAGQVYTQLQQM